MSGRKRYPRSVTPAVVPLKKAIEALLAARIAPLEAKAVKAERAGNRGLAKEFRAQQSRYQITHITTKLGTSTIEELLKGGIKKVPSSKTICAFAQVVGCLPAETNRLLAVAGWQVREPHLLQVAVSQLMPELRAFLAALPYPALLVDGAWQVHGVNALFRRLWNVPDGAPVDVPQTIMSRGGIFLFDTARHPVTNPPVVNLIVTQTRIGSADATVVGLVPADALARAWFTEVGLPNADNGWQRAGLRPGPRRGTSVLRYYPPALSLRKRELPCHTNWDAKLWDRE